MDEDSDEDSIEEQKVKRGRRDKEYIQPTRIKNDMKRVYNLRKNPKKTTRMEENLSLSVVQDYIYFQDTSEENDISHFKAYNTQMNIYLEQ